MPSGRLKRRSRRSDLLVDARGLAGQIAQVVELGAPYRTAPLHADFADRGTVGLEHALHALAVRDLAHRERRIQTAILLGDHHTFVGLNALAITLHDLDLHDHGIAGIEIREFALRALAVQFLDDLVH